MRYTVGFVFSNKYDTIKNHNWGEKGGIVSKLRNYINIPDGTHSSMICRYEGCVVSEGGWSQIQTQSERLEQNWEEIHYCYGLSISADYC